MRRTEGCHGNFVISHVKLHQITLNFAPKLRSNSSPRLLVTYDINPVITSFGCCLVPRPHYSARPMRFRSRGPRKFLRPRQTRRSETFCLTWGGAFGSGQAVNNFSALMKDVQQPWRVQRNKHFYSMHVFIVEGRLAFLFHLSH